MCIRTMVAVAFTALALCLAGCQPMAYLMSTLLQILRAEASTVRDGPDDRMTLLYATTDCQRSQLWRGLFRGTASRCRHLARRAGRPGRSRRPGAPIVLERRRPSHAAPGKARAASRVRSERGTRCFEWRNNELLDVFVYVHGANNGVYRTPAQAAQCSMKRAKTGMYRQFTERRSVVVAFAWPTGDNYLDYPSDVRNARRSRSTSWLIALGHGS